VRVPQAGVAGGGESAVVLPHVAHARAPPLRDEARGLVGGAVVDDDDLDVGESLGEGAVDGVGKIPGVVVRRDHDGHARG
jgi:hypothetical protein